MIKENYNTLFNIIKYLFLLLSYNNKIYTKDILSSNYTNEIYTKNMIITNLINDNHKLYILIYLYFNKKTIIIQFKNLKLYN